MRRFLVLFVVLAVVLLAVPGFIGFQAEERYQALIKHFDPRGGLQLTQNEYRRGWFGATAKSQFKLVRAATAQEQAPKGLSFSLVSEISHGPLTASGFGLAEIVSRIEIDGESPLVEDYTASIKTLVAFDGAGVAYFDLPATELASTDGRRAVNFLGATGRVSFARGLDQIEIGAQMLGLRVAEGDSRLFEIGRVSLQSSSRRGVAGLMLGGGVFTIERLELKDSESDTRISLHALEVDVESSAQGEMVSAWVRYHLQTINVNGQLYGPAEIKIGMSRLSAKVLGQIRQSMEEINAQGLPQAQRGMAMAMVLFGSGPGLLKGDPRLELERLHVQTPQGEIDGRFTLQSVGLEWTEMADMAAVADRLVAEVELRMPEYFYRLAFVWKAQADILRQLEWRKLMGQEIETPPPIQLQEMASRVAEQQLQQLLTQDILLRDGSDLKIQATLKDGLLSVNGKTIPFPPTGR